MAVDGVPSLLACIAMTHREENYNEEARNAGQAIDHPRSNGADLLLSDIRMPHTRGLTLVIGMRAEPASIYVRREDLRRRVFAS